MSGSSGTGVLSIARSNDPFLSPAENQNISSVLSGAAWNARTITYSFPTTSEVYGTQAIYGDPAPFNGFLPVTAQQERETLRGFSLITSYTGVASARSVKRRTRMPPCDLQTPFRPRRPTPITPEPTSRPATCSSEGWDVTL